jgi:RNA polymerase sigma-70 factor (ECF subfamily)
VLDEVTDESLASRVASGDIAAFSTLYDRYAPRIHAWAAHVLGVEQADDAVQEVFLRLWLKARQFDAERGRFGAWYTAVARHYLFAELERRGRYRAHLAAEEIQRALASAAASDDVEERVSAHERDRVLARALTALPPDQRRVLVLGYFLGLSQSRMARELGLPLGTVKKRVRLGMQKLRTALAGEENAPRLRVVDE